MIGAAINTVTYVINNKTFDYANMIKGSYIKSAELKHIKHVLGETFYDAIDATPASYATLMSGYLKEAIAWYTVYESLPFLNIQITDKGIMLNDSETANQAQDKQRGELRNSLLSIADSFRDDMMTYINDNKTLYPLYDTTEDLTKTTKIIGGIILNV